jgi:predicted nucleotidyltransferase
MNRIDVVRALKSHEAELKELGVEHLFLFGSVARGEADSASDVDLFFDHQKGRLGLHELLDVKQKTQEILGIATDIMTRASLHPLLREQIEKAAQRIF